MIFSESNRDGRAQAFVPGFQLPFAHYDLPMTSSQRLALLLCPLMLRIVLGITFTFAGMGYLFGEVGFKGADAAALANLGVAIAPTTPNAKPDGTAGMLPAPGGAPTLRNQRSNPGTKPSPVMDPADIAKNPPNPLSPADPEPLPAFKAESRRPVKATDSQSKPTEKNPTATKPAAPTMPGASEDFKPQLPAPRFAAYQFGQPIGLRKVYLTALKIHYAAFPPPRSVNPTSVVPAFLAAGMVPVYVAHTAAVAELMAGVLLLLGVYCRFWALLTGAIMLGAILIDQVAPALRSGNTTLWLLPGPGPGQAWHELDVFRGLLWQAALAAMSFCIVLIGAGAVALDNAQLFAAKTAKLKRGRGAEVEDDQ